MDGELHSGPAADGGRACMQRLAMAAIESLQRAGLDDSMRQVNARIFARSSTELVEWFPTPEGPQCRYRPMVELVLLEVAAVAQNEELDAAERRRRIIWALDVGGF